MSVGRRLVTWYARKAWGMELHYPPRADPPLEPVGTLRNDRTPCAPPPPRPGEQAQADLAARVLSDQADAARRGGGL
ncbi:MAG TPA: hypothetical protein VFE12_00105 [Acetobacteraceae bacterium]|jgi:hypothetical protein|nr:hypothetical protein [Acetobacteraceae bacterium]